MAKNSKKSNTIVSDSSLRIEIKKKRKPAKKTKSSYMALKVIVIIILIAALAYLLTSTKKVETVEYRNFSVSQDYAVSEPYTIVEEYQDTEPIGPPKCGNTQMNFTTAGPWVSIAANSSLVCSFNITNLESQEGTWEYQAYLQGAVGNRYDKKTIDAYSTETFTFSFGPNPGSFQCGISVISLPSIERCFFPKETFYQVVTKTRNATKYRNVTMAKQTPVYNQTTVIRTVSRFFGYPMVNFGW